MSQSIRQSELFAGEEWRVLYQAFTEINFNSYDFDTIRSSMVEYIRFNFPEDFNDWIESSEFVALIDLIAYFGQTLVFRMDLNTRENFIEDAERKESVLKLARMLSYTPSRNIPARGLVKIRTISTTESIIDSMGNNLQNLPIIWNDINNPDWFEQWVLVMNSAFIQTNPFGKPVKRGSVSNIPVQIYTIDSVPTSNAGQYSFSAVVNNRSLPFEVVNVDFVDNESYFEVAPNPFFSFNLLYRNDGNGNASPNTGFFLYFKQGTLSFDDFEINVPIENRVIDVNRNNINNFDVWVQSIQDDGFIQKTWTRVPAVFGNNIIFNSLNENVRDIFSVISRENDQVSIRFADGVFGNVPAGTIRVWYRTSANQSYTILPDDIRDINIQIIYINNRNEQHTLTVTFELLEPVGNSVVSETIDQIKERAPQVYYAQNRMVNGEDYNVFPLQNTNILKLKSINRVYSGHSRYIDINDPTSTYSKTNVFSRDGVVYQEINNNYFEIPLSANLSPSEIVSVVLFNFLKNPELLQFFYQMYPIHDDFEQGNPNKPGLISQFPLFNNTWLISWESKSNSNFSSTGSFRNSNKERGDLSISDLGNNPVSGSVPISVGQATVAQEPIDLITPGSLIKFANAGWVKVEQIIGDGFTVSATVAGGVILSEPVSTNDWVIAIRPAFRTDFTHNEVLDIRNEIDSSNTFGIRYNYATLSWEIITAINLAPWDSTTQQEQFSLANAGDNTFQNKDASWLFRFDYTSDRWQITVRGLRFIFESEKDVRFFVNQFTKVAGKQTGRASQDTITVLGTNSGPGYWQNIGPIGKDLVWREIDIFLYEDGFVEPRRVLVTYSDKDLDGVPDNPEIFDIIVGSSLEIIVDAAQNLETIPLPEQYIFHRRFVDVGGLDYFEIDGSIIAIFDFEPVNINNLNPDNKIGYYVNRDGTTEFINQELSIQVGTVVYVIDPDNNGFYTYLGGDRTNINNYRKESNNDFKAHIGRKNIDFVWTHIAPKENRIDPAITNIIDNYVLTVTYDTDYRRWVAIGDSNSEPPQPPTTEQLKIDFFEFEQAKMVTDEIVWRPVVYRPLFGDRAPSELRARFKVVKVPGTQISDNEIKTRVIQAINTFFSVGNWEFGETFFASEMSAFVHQQLPTIVAGFEVVPINESSKFGNLQQIKAESDELFISTATVSDVEIVPAFTQTSLRISN